MKISLGSFEMEIGFLGGFVLFSAFLILVKASVIVATQNPELAQESITLVKVSG